MSVPNGPSAEPIDLPMARRLSGFALRLGEADLSPGRRAKLPLLLADFVGCVLAGSTLPEASSAFILARPGEVAIPGDDRRMTAESAAIAMGTLGALLQIHDGFGGGGNHPCSSIVPALWCLRGERPHADLLLPLAVGYEVANRLAALSHPDQTLAGLAPTSSCGAIGATAALGRMLNLDVGTLADAICNAAFSFPVAALQGLNEHGSMVPLHGGLAARCAIEAVTLAQAGLRAGTTVLEGGEGPGAMAVMRCRSEPLTPETWRGETLDRVYFKPIPACRHAQPAIEAILSMLRHGPVDPARIARVDIETYPMALRFGRPPAPAHELYDRLMSVTWAVASTFAHGGFGLDNVLAPAREAAVESLYPRIRGHVDPDFAASYPGHFSTRIVVVLDDGSTRVGECRMEYGVASEDGPYSPRGTTTAPLDRAGLQAKFTGFARRRMDAPSAAALWDALTRSPS